MFMLCKTSLQSTLTNKIFARIRLSSEKFHFEIKHSGKKTLHERFFNDKPVIVRYYDIYTKIFVRKLFSQRAGQLLREVQKA